MSPVRRLCRPPPASKQLASGAGVGDMAVNNESTMLELHVFFLSSVALFSDFRRRVSFLPHVRVVLPCGHHESDGIADHTNSRMRSPVALPPQTNIMNI